MPWCQLGQCRDLPQVRLGLGNPSAEQGRGQGWGNISRGYLQHLAMLGPVGHCLPWHNLPETSWVQSVVVGQPN